MEKKDNILLITDVCYWKQEIGSHQRVYALIEYLKLHLNLIIVYIDEEKREENSIDINKLNYEVIFLNSFEESSYNTEGMSIFLNKYPILNQFYNKNIVAKTQTLLKKYDFSYIIVEYIKLSYLMPLFKNKITILDTHDIMAKRNDSFKKNNQKHWIDITETEELAILSLYDKVICIQKIEYDYLINKNIKSICCPHPVNVENCLHKITPNDKKEIIFIAAYSIANNNSIKWFLDNIWIFFKDVENLQLNIYGEVSRSLQGYEKKYSNIILHGKIVDLKLAYKNATIAINPVQMGGGLKIKNIEALGYGIPLITTTEGSKGLETEVDNSFLLANTKDEWIEKILSLIISEELRFKLSKNSLSFISKYFNSDACFKDLVSFIKKN